MPILVSLALIVSEIYVIQKGTDRRTWLYRCWSRIYIYFIVSVNNRFLYPVGILSLFKRKKYITGRRRRGRPFKVYKLLIRVKRYI